MKALDYALRLIKIRLRSETELKGRLLKKGYSEEEIKRTIDQLTESRLVDDYQFARLWVRSQNSLKPSGEQLLRLKLREFGVDKEIVDRVISESQEEFSDLSKARRVLESKLRMYGKIEDKYEKKTKTFSIASKTRV